MTVVPAFLPGTAIRVLDIWPERDGPVHIRTPHYLRGVAGRIERCLGVFANPEDLAFDRAAPLVPLYHVAFDAGAVWPDRRGQNQVIAEIFEHWLEPLE